MQVNEDFCSKQNCVELPIKKYFLMLANNDIHIIAQLNVVTKDAMESKNPTTFFFLLKVKAQKSFITKIENDFNVVTNIQDILPKTIISYLHLYQTNLKN